MKIKSLIKEVDISNKSILLKKYTSESITSERFFNIEEQPSNTCPIIYSAISEKREILSRFSELNIEGQSVVQLYATECDCRENCADILNQNLSSARIFHTELIHTDYCVTELINRLEELRGNCSELREYGHEVKKIIWLIYEEGIDIKDLYLTLKSKKPNDAMAKSVLDQAYQEILLNIPSYEEKGCRNNCINHKKNISLQGYFSSMAVPILYSDYITSAFDNYSKIDIWVQDLEQFLEDSILKNQKSKVIDNDMQLDYLKCINLNQQRVFLSRHPSVHIRLIDGEKELDEFISNTEDLGTAQKISDLIPQANALIQEFKSISIDKDYSELIREFSNLYIPLTEIKNILDSFNGTDYLLDLNKALLPLRAPINTMVGFIEKYSPQEFLIVD
jgi:hypothetical protein